MGIVVACRCGQALEADLDLAGKVVQCPVCRNPIVVPTPRPTEVYSPIGNDFIANQTLAEVSGLASAPRFASPDSRKNREATETMGIFLVAGVVIFLLVVVLSVGIVGYIRWNDLSARFQPAPPPASTTSGLVQTPSPAAERPPAIISVRGESTVVPPGWTPYEHPVARYRVILPDPPEVIERTLEVAGGDRVFHVFKSTLNAHTYEACRETRMYAVTKGEESVAYDSVARRRVAEIQGSIVRTQTLTVNGHSACDMILQGTADGAQVRQYLRLIAVGNSVLELSCRVPPGKERADEIGAFLANYTMDLAAADSSPE